MPPKRASTGSQSDGSAAKKAKVAALAAAIPKNRFSKLSATRNAYMDYQKVHEDGKGYEFLTTCVPISQRPDDDDDEEEEEEDEEEENNKPEHPTCDGGKTCMCRKSPEEHPDYPWVCSAAGWAKFFSCLHQLMPRDPDRFGMYTFNDHAPYGSLEITENLIQDYVEAKDNWREQWAICEAMVHWLTDDGSDQLVMPDDSSRVENIIALAGSMLLTTLARLEREKVVTEVPSLRVILAIALTIPSVFRQFDYFEDSCYAGGDFDAGKLNSYVLAWAKKHNIELRGPNGLDQYIKECQTVKLPAPTAKKNDPFGFGAAYKSYAKSYGSAKKGIGGDQFDITAWSAAERKAKSFTKKDPLKKADLDALKDGGIMMSC